MSTSDKINLSNNNPVNDFLREALLAIGLVLLILGSLWIATGQFPPMVVVESGSMMHDTEDGSLGAIDPGDLVLVMNPNRVNIVTYVEAMEEDNQNFGYTSHGMEGDVIIYSKNGGSDTPVIHRAILKVVSNNTEEGEETWDVLGTSLRNVHSVNLTINYPCIYHGGTYNLEIIDWIPNHSGFITTGDNPNSNGCKIDQLAATGQDGRNGLKDEAGNPVTAVKDEWVIGVASSEIPWIGAIKLFTSNTHHFVTEETWTNLSFTILFVICSPMIYDSIFRKNERIFNSEEE
ncbi:MAG: S26 family signal peptidase [Candidatus Poseidoniales archaeon]|nr:MAG: S26 family signal peptidase [Candidatus Poseidoniales archaeon]